MREILFRAYSKTLKEYIVKEFSIFGEWLTFDMFGQFISENWGKYKEYYDSKLLAVNDFVIEQFTGFTDKNGNKIFEGDILYIEDDDGNKYVTQVWYERGGLVIDVKGCDYDYTVIGWLEYYYSMEIIGNIHDNPELLEATK
jgi:uncharacterized phage protein (TIGR01671 family)